MLSPPGGTLGSKALLDLRDKQLDALNAHARETGSSAMRDFIDRNATSRDQLRLLQDRLRVDGEDARRRGRLVDDEDE